MGAIAGPYAADTMSGFALHILDELIHHGAEVGTVRDFYRGTHPEDLFNGKLTPAERPTLLAEAAAARRWELIPQLADQGFDLNAKTASGCTAAHLAAGTGNLDTLRFLVYRGADLAITDAQFQADVLGWAKWSQQTEAIKYLETL
jgi:hypothetical protein